MSEMPKIETPPVDTRVEIVDKLSRGDLADLCQAADDAIQAGGGFGWLRPPRRDVMESYWKGVLLVPDRTLFVGRLDGVIVGSAQLVRPTKNNEAQAHTAQLTTSFIAPHSKPTSRSVAARSAIRPSSSVARSIASASATCPMTLSRSTEESSQPVGSIPSTTSCGSRTASAVTRRS